MRFVIAVLVLLTMYLQYALWVTRGGIHDVNKLKVSVAEQKDEIARLKERNRSLAAEVMDLKQGLEAVEERSRSEMGMIKRGEVFFRITDPNHEHDRPQHAGSADGYGAEPPLEPPLDPLVPGDLPRSDALDEQTAPLATPQSVPPIVKPITNPTPEVTTKPRLGTPSKSAPKPPVKAATEAPKPRKPPATRPTRPSDPKPILPKAVPVE